MEGGDLRLGFQCCMPGKRDEQCTCQEQMEAMTFSELEPS